MKRIGLYVVVLMYLLTMCSNDIVTVERALVDRGSDDYVGNNQVWDFSSVPVLDSNVVTDLSGNVIELNNYYPYGSLFSENDIAQPYKYSGKEFENRNGLKWRMPSQKEEAGHGCVQARWLQSPNGILQQNRTPSSAELDIFQKFVVTSRL